MSDRNAAHEANILNATHAATSVLKRIRESLDAELTTIRAENARLREALVAFVHWYAEDSTEFKRDTAYEMARRALGEG